jgi:uncharacterized protein (TIGR03435 family)
VKSKELAEMLRAIMGAGLVIFTCCAAWAQTAENSPAFEVASVKPAAPITDNRIMVMLRGGPGSPDPGQITYTNVTVKNVLTQAYGVKSFQISGPSWLDSERYDIVAKVPRGATKAEFMVMLQNLLAERFKLTLHREKKDLSMYALVVGKNGPKMKESVEDPAPEEGDAPKAGGPAADDAMAAAVMRQLKMARDGIPVLPPGSGGRGTVSMMMGSGNARMTATKQTMASMAEMLSNQLDLPVVDMTGLTGKYDYRLSYAPEGGIGFRPPPGIGPPPPAAPPPGEGGPGMPMAGAPDGGSSPNLFTALQEQLGLKLEQRKGPVDLLVIDHLEKVPVEN